MTSSTQTTVRWTVSSAVYSTLEACAGSTRPTTAVRGPTATVDQLFIIRLTARPPPSVSKRRPASAVGLQFKCCRPEYSATPLTPHSQAATNVQKLGTRKLAEIRDAKRIDWYRKWGGVFPFPAD